MAGTEVTPSGSLFQIALGLLVLPALPWLSACPIGAGDDDSATPAGDDDDESPPPQPLADVIGVFNLTNFVRADGSSYVDFSGILGTYTSIDTSTWSPAAYLGAWGSYAAEAPALRWDMGSWPFPAEGTGELVDLATWTPWAPGEQIYWDAGPRIGLGNYLASRVDFTDGVRAYEVDDPLSPGGAAWTPGAGLGWENEGGAPPQGGGDTVVASSFPSAVPLPQPVSMLSPAESESAVPVPAALDLAVQWVPQEDGAFVTVTLLRDQGLLYVARVADASGEWTIPPAVLHDSFGPGPLELIVGRNLETALPHPQGSLLVRTREERRVPLDLLPDLVVEPPFGQPGQSLDLDARWFTGGFATDTPLDFGAGIHVEQIAPDSSDPQHASVRIAIDPDAPLGGRDVTVGAGDSAFTLPSGFSVLDLLPQDDCADAGAAPALAPGSYSSTTAGLANDLSSGFPCLTWSLGGADAVYRVDLEAGDTLLATLEEAAPADGALVLLASCADPASALACADVGYQGDPEVLAFTAESDQTLFLLVDGYYFTGAGAFSSPFRLEIAILRQVLDPAWIVPGSSQSFVLSGDDAWDAGLVAANVSFGDGVTVDSVAEGSAAGDLLVGASAAADAEAGPRDVSVDDPSLGVVTFPEALWVTEWPLLDGCADAKAADAFGTASGAGYAPGAADDFSQVSCFAWASLGPDLLFPVELAAGETLDVHLESTDDTQLYVLSDCGDPGSCVPEAAADVGLFAEPEDIVGWAPANPGRYYVVVDVYGGLLDPSLPFSYTLDLAISSP